MAKYARQREDAGPDGAVFWNLSGVGRFTLPSSFSAVCEALEPWEQPLFMVHDPFPGKAWRILRKK